ncbi:hypothetical protein FRC19_010274 [Serendipita sp. 401]|nr:hypothetical protein FRC15_005539 [Serendipita sp. 397]KAG8825879.1 hypothetical protein FRC19_010274 [Serendipita sp. 401]KAG8829661.1 hypothetical protein FRC18_009165 [Serendipita sp. 400]KAG9056120.1 hypothetical protein FS842_000259 [Serendipita sp. 407]
MRGANDEPIPFSEHFPVRCDEVARQYRLLALDTKAAWHERARQACNTQSVGKGHSKPRSTRDVRFDKLNIINGQGKTVYCPWCFKKIVKVVSRRHMMSCVVKCSYPLKNHGGK